MAVPDLMGISRLLPEQPGRAEQENGDEDDEDSDLPEALAQEEAADRFRHPDDETAEKRAGETAHPAQHYDGESDQHEAMTDRRIGVKAGQQETGRGAQASDANAEAHGEDMIDIDAHEPRAVAFPRDRTDRLAKIGPPHEKPKRAGDDQGTEERHHLWNGDEGKAEIDRGEAIRGAHGPRVRGPEIERQILDDDRQPQGREQHILVAPIARAGDDETLQRIAEAEH